MDSAEETSNKHSEDEESLPSDDNAAPSNLRADLSKLTFQELQDLKEKLGTKKFNSIYSTKAAEHRLHKVKFTRENKNRPREMSSKRPVGVCREIFSVKKRVTRDPRFDDLSGKLDEKVFEKQYRFLKDIQSKEENKLRQMLKTETDPDIRNKITDLLTRMAQKKKAVKEVGNEKKFEQKLKLERKKALKAGKRPYFLKESQKKELVLAEKYKNLKKQGKLESFMNKKRKKRSDNVKALIPQRQEKTVH